MDLQKIFSLIDKGKLSDLQKEINSCKDVGTLLTATRTDPVEFTEFTETDKLEFQKYLGSNALNMNSLHFAIFSASKFELIEEILKNYPKDKINSRWGNGNTALHLASFLADSDAIKALIAAGADASIKNEHGYSAVETSCDKETRDLFDTFEKSDTVTSLASKTRRKSTMNYKIRKSASRQKESLGTGEALGNLIEEHMETMFPPNKVSNTSVEFAGRFVSDSSVNHTSSSSIENMKNSALNRVRNQSPMKMSPSKKKPRDSVDTISEGHFSSPLKTQHSVFVRICSLGEVMVNVKKEAKLRCVVKYGKNVSRTRTFENQRNILLNEEFRFNFSKGEPLIVEFRKKRSKERKILGGADSNKDDQLEKDKVIGQIIIPPSVIEKNCCNKIESKQMAWQTVNNKSPIAGFATLQLFYSYHEGKAPENISECLEISNHISYQKNHKIWKTGIVNVMLPSQQGWKERLGVLKGGLLQLLIPQTNKVVDVVHFTGFEDADMLSPEDCPIANSFYIRTSKGEVHLYCNNRTESREWLVAILEMVDSFQYDELESVGLSRSGSIRSIASTVVG